LALKNTQSLVKALMASTSDGDARVELFAEIYAAPHSGFEDPEYNDAAFQMFAQFLTNTVAKLWEVEKSDGSDKPRKIKDVLSAKSGTIPRTPLLQAVATTFPNLRERATPAYAELLARLKAVPATQASKSAPFNMKHDAALLIMWPYCQRELDLDRSGREEDLSARRLQRTFRRHKIANMVWRQQHALWMMFYDHYDALLHSGERAKYRGVFDLGEFSILLESAYGGPVATELIMLVFNEWHDRADMLMDKADHSVQRERLEMGLSGGTTVSNP